MRILVTGKTGQLGRSIKKIILNSYEGHEYVFTDRLELDFNDKNSISSYFKYQKFDVVINCAAYTSVDKAEKEKDLASLINHHAVRQISEILTQHNTKFIHISTDYVFDGESKTPYKEEDIPNPINFYGETKYKGEQAIQKYMPNNAVIIRSGWVYSEFGNNFLDTILKLGMERDKIKMVYDQIGSPTYATDLAKAIIIIINSKNFNDDNKKTTIYHYSNEGSCSWYDFTLDIFKFAKIQCSINPIKAAEYQSNVRRPRSSLMSKEKIIKDFNLVIPNYQDSIKQCISLIRS